MSKEQLENKLKEIKEQLKVAEVNYHRLSGAIALLEELLVEANKPIDPDTGDSKKEL